jgi:hypothetical protein
MNANPRKFSEHWNIGTSTSVFSNHWKPNFIFSAAKERKNRKINPPAPPVLSIFPNSEKKFPKHWSPFSKILRLTRFLEFQRP